MKNKITLTIIAILFLNVITLQAQDNEDTKPSKWEFGAGIGINVADYLQIASIDFRDGFRAKIGLEGHGIVSYKISNRFKIKAKPGFVMLNNYIFQHDFSTYFLELPLMLDIKIWKGISVELGVSKLFLLGINESGELKNRIFSQTLANEFYSPHFGLNYEINNRWGINLKGNFVIEPFMKVAVETKDFLNPYVILSDVNVASMNLSFYYKFNN